MLFAFIFMLPSVFPYITPLAEAEQSTFSVFQAILCEKIAIFPAIFQNFLIVLQLLSGLIPYLISFLILSAEILHYWEYAAPGRSGRYDQFFLLPNLHSVP